MGKSSVCSRRRSLSFFWRSCVDGKHIDAAVEALMKSIQQPARVTGNAYIDADNEAMFRARLEMAEQGRLQPDEHVKTISFDPELDMFEIRWLEAQAVPQDLVTGLYGNREASINVRLYYIELGHPWVVGLVVHEKTYGEDADETNRLQNEKIECAVTLCRGDSAQWWGVPELEARHGTPGPDLTTRIT